MRGVGLGTDVMKQVFQVYPTMYDGNYPSTHMYLRCGRRGWACSGAITYLAMVLHQIQGGREELLPAPTGRPKISWPPAWNTFALSRSHRRGGVHLVLSRNMFILLFLSGVIAAAIKLSKEKTA